MVTRSQLVIHEVSSTQHIIASLTSTTISTIKTKPLGEMVKQSQLLVTHEVSSTQHIIRSDLEALRKDVADVQNSMRTHVLRNGQETTSKLSQVSYIKL